MRFSSSSAGMCSSAHSATSSLLSLPLAPFKRLLSARQYPAALDSYHFRGCLKRQACKRKAHT